MVPTMIITRDMTFDVDSDWTMTSMRGGVAFLVGKYWHAVDGRLLNVNAGENKCNKNLSPFHLSELRLPVNENRDAVDLEG